MSIEDDLIDQERWERTSAAYKRTHPAPCTLHPVPELVRSQKMPSYCEEQYIHALEKELKEKDAMLDWLANKLAGFGNINYEASMMCPENITYKPIMECVAEHGSCADCWKEAAKAVVKKNT